MYAKNITYTDFNGKNRTETFYFNLTATELARLNFEKEGSLAAYLQRLMNANDENAIAMAFENIILMAYGEKSEDGRYFRKSEEISKAFMQSAAYDVLFQEFATDEKASYDFVMGVVPQSLAEKVKTMDANEIMANAVSPVPNTINMVAGTQA